MTCIHISLLTQFISLKYQVTLLILPWMMPVIKALLPAQGLPVDSSLSPTQLWGQSLCLIKLCSPVLWNIQRHLDLQPAPLNYWHLSTVPISFLTNPMLLPHLFKLVTSTWLSALNQAGMIPYHPMSTATAMFTLHMQYLWPSLPRYVYMCLCSAWNKQLLPLKHRYRAEAQW